MSDDATTGTCGICGERVDVEDLLGHLRGAHDLDVKPETWPDGSWVVIDKTLEPADFAEGGATE